jgi:parvulin-like peptidyl-prolyl isomerase
MRSHFLLAVFGGLVIAMITPMSIAAEGALAVIDGNPVSYAEYEQFAYAEARQTFYHGAPPEGEAFIEFRRKAADKLIDRKLKVAEARRRGMQPDNEQIDTQLASYEAQYGHEERWQREGDAMLARLRGHFEEESLLRQIEPILREVPVAAEGDVETYYHENIDKFTEPEKVRVAVILLSVPPSSDESEWDAARDEAAAIAESIRGGQSFAEAAREHSADPTAANGGDMGFMHAGSLNYAVQDAVSDLEPGDMADQPVTVLEGVVLVKLEERKAAAIRVFDDVRERARGLWERDASDRAFAATLARLRSESDIQMDEEYLRTWPK